MASRDRELAHATRGLQLPFSLLRPAMRQTVWLVLLILVTALSLLSDVFLTPYNILNILRQVSIVGAVSVGMTFVLIGGAFDLSVGTILAFCAIVAINLQPVDTPRSLAAIVIPLLLGSIVGVVNGIFVGWVRGNPFIVTLGMQYVVLGITLFYTGGQHVWVWEPAPVFAFIGSGYLFGIPMPVIVLAGLVVVAHMLLEYTTFGRHIFAVGNNETAARLAGVPTARIRCLTFVLSGLSAAVGGLILGSRVKNLDPTAGIGYEFDAITAVVLGGTSLLGGRGSVMRTVAGVLLLGVLTNGMILLNLAYQYQLLVRGVILVVAVSLDVLTRRARR